MFNTNKFIGIPFVDHGRDFKGCDCWGLVTLVYKSFNVDLPDFNISCDDTNKIIKQVSITSSIETMFEQIEKPQEKCLVLMSTDPLYKGAINHIGVYVGNGRFLHTFRKTQSCIEKITHPFWKRKIKEFYIWKQFL